MKLIQTKAAYSDNLKDFNGRARPQKAEGENKKNAYDLFESQEIIHNAFRSGVFPRKTQVKRLRNEITNSTCASKSR